MLDQTIDKKSIEKESFDIFIYIIEKHFKGREIVVGHSLITFIQFFLIMEVVYPKDFLNRIHNKIDRVRSSNLNAAILSNGPFLNQPIRNVASYLKEVVDFIFLNKKLRKNNFSFEIVCYLGSQ